MSRTPGRKTDDPADEGELLQVDEVSFYEVGERLVDLGTELQRVGHEMDSDRLRQLERELREHGLDAIIEELDTSTDMALHRTLTGLRTFRREYDRWERLVAEYVMAKHNYTQRDTAKHLGVGVSTVNRWAQNPLKVQEYR